jgi:hypothetical protein
LQSLDFKILLQIKKKKNVDKTFKFLEWTILFFFKHRSSLLNVHHSSSKLEMILTLMIKINKKLKFVKFKFTLSTCLNTFGSNIFLVQKIVNFEDVTLTKIIHFYVIKNINA